MSQFEEPTLSSQLDLGGLLGALVIVEPTEVVRDINTRFGASDAVRATVTVVDGDHAGAIYNDALIFPRLLQGQLRSKIGKKVLGRVARGAALKAGQDPPWMLEKANPGDEKKATDFLARTQFTSADDIL